MHLIIIRPSRSLVHCCVRLMHTSEYALTTRHKSSVARASRGAQAGAHTSWRQQLYARFIRTCPPVPLSVVVFAAFDSGRSKRLLLADLERAARAFLRAQSVFSPSTPNDVRVICVYMALECTFSLLA